MKCRGQRRPGSGYLDSEHATKCPRARAKRVERPTLRRFRPHGSPAHQIPAANAWLGKIVCERLCRQPQIVAGGTGQ
jgi:hypothetical protein